MDKLKLLYQSYLDKGLISEKTSFDQFSSASPKQLMSLYSLGIENNLISQKTELDTFSSAWYPEKKKDLSEVSALQSLEGPSASDTSTSFMPKGEAPLDTKVPEALKTEVSTPKFEPTKAVKTTAVPKQEVTTEDWWADKWNGLIEGFQTFASNVSDENNMNGDAIADFIQDNKTKKPELFASFNESLKLLKARGYDDASGRGMAANIAYTNFWNKDNNIENEVLPYIRRKGREKAIENFGVQIDEKVQKELGDRFFSSAVRGLATSTPAMLTSASTMGMSFFNMSYNNAEEQLAMQLAENPDLNMTSGEKETYKIANAGIEAVLERIGLSNALKGNPMLKRAITGKVLTTLTQTGGNIGAEAFEKIVKQEVKGLSGYARKVAAGSISEFETGALQQLSNDLINQYVTDSQGRNVFSPKTAKEIAGDVIYAGAQEAVGGGIISGVVAPFQKSALEMTKEDFDSGIDFAKNVNIDKASEYLNKQVDAGKISRQEADATLSRMQEFRNSANKLPDDVDSKTQYELFQLIAEKQKIQKSVAGKDDAIQETAKPKIDAINEKIQQIYEGGKEAVATTPETIVETVEVAEAAPVASVEDQAKQSLKQRTKEELATLNELELEEYNQLRRSIIKDITELSITDREQEREGIRNKITNGIRKYNNLFEKDDRQKEAGIPSPIVEGEAPIEAQPIEGAGQETPEAVGVLQVPIEEGVEEVTPTAIEEAPVGVTEEVNTSQPEPNKRFEEEKKRLQTEIIRLQEIEIDEISRIRQAIRDVQGTEKLAKIDGTVVNEGTIEQIYGYYEPLIANLENELRDLLKSSKPAEETKVSPVAEPVVEVVTPIAEPAAVSDVKLTADDFFFRDPATKFVSGGVFSDVLRAILFEGNRFKSGRSRLYWYRKNIDEYFSTAAGQTLPPGTTLSQMLGDSISFASIEKDQYENFKEAVKKLGVDLDELTIKVAKTDRPSVYRDVLYDKIESQAPTAAVTPTEQPVTEEVSPAVQEIEAARQKAIEERGLKSEEINIGDTNEEFARKMSIEIELQKLNDRYDARYAALGEIKPVEATAAVSEEETELIADIELYENRIEDLKEEIQLEKGNIKEELERLRGEIVNVRSQKLPADEKRELIEELKGEIQGAKDDNESLIDLYKQDINALRADIRKAQKRLDKIREKKATAAPVAVQVAKRPVVEAVDISAENFAESFPSLFSFLKSGAVYRSGLSDSAGKKKELAKDRIKVDSLLKSAKVGLRDAKILIAVMSDYKPKKMADIAEFNRAYIEAENLLAKLEKLNKGNTPNTSSTKAEAIAKINSSNRLNQKQKEVMVTVVNSLKAEQLFILDLDIDEDGYGFANNLLTSKSAYSFIHEVGHWAYYNLLSAKDRIDYMDYMSEKFLNNEFTGLVYPVEGLATNAMDSYQEYFANQFDQWYTNQAGAENVLSTMFIKLKDIVDNLIKLFQSKGYNPDLIKYFDKIVDTTKFNMVPDKINQMDNKLINDEQLESESFGNSNELAKEIVSQEKVEELDIKLDTMLDKAKKAWLSMWWNKDQGQIRVFKEQQESLVWLEKRKIKAFSNRLNDLLKGADKETIRIAFDLLSGKAEPEQISILEKKKNGSLIFGHVNLLRNYIDSLTESILFSPSFSKLPPTTQDAMIDNMGTYLRGSYRFWKDKKFFPSKELQTKAVQEVFDVKYSNEFARLVSLFDTKGLSDKVLSLENLYNQIKQNIIEEEKLLEVGQKTSEMKAMESNLSEIGKELSSERKNLKDQASLMKKLVGSSELTPENIKAFEAMKDDYIAESMASESNKLKVEARDEVRAYLEESKKLRESNDFKSGKISSSSIKIPSQEFKRKKELLPSIKALLGEEKDPIIKFSDTAVALANIKHKGDMVYKISRAFKGKELIKNEATKSELATGEYRIVTDKFSPLNGKYISRQVFDAITDPDIYAADHWFASLYFDTLKFSRKSKTIWNPPGWGKNLRGGWFTMMANGVVNINVLRDLKRRGELLFNDMSDEETEQLIIEAANKGLMGQSVDANLIGGINLIYSRSVDGEDTDIDTLTNYVGKKLQKGKAQVIGFDNWLSRKYGAIDDYTKLVIYRAEKLSFAKKLYGEDYKDLTAGQQNEVMDAAAETVKRTTPTWSRLPPAYFKIAKTPFGDFLGFDFESIRSFIANFATGYSDLQKAATSKSLSKAQRDEYLKAGSRRLAGTAMVYGPAAAVAELVQQLMLGDDDELAEDLNSLAPDWAAGHKLVFTGINKDGIATFYDYTLEDPYAKMFDLTTGKYGLNRLVADYMSPNMAIGTIYNMTQGMDHYGRPISNSYDPAYIKAAKILGYGAKETFIPPFISSNVRDEVREYQLSKEQYSPLDAIGRVSSRAFIRDYKTNIGQQMYFTIKAFATKKEDYTDLSGMSRANRLRELDEIKRMYKAIGNVAMAKENYALYSDATKNIERYFNTPEKWYILYDYELPEEK
jgi:hypothetical protein